MLTRSWVRAIAVILLMGVFGAACKAGGNEVSSFTTVPPAVKVKIASIDPLPAGVPAPTKIALSAVATGPVVDVYAAPGGPEITMKLDNPTIERQTLAFEAIDQQPGWLLVRLPERPNGSTGWIQTSQVTTAPLANRIVISLSEHNLRVLDPNQQVIYQTDIANGKPRTPTPTGRFYEDIWLPNPGAPYGTFMLSIAGFSDVLKTFDGGRGQIAMHGWADTSVMGSAASNGCVRMRNVDIQHLSTLAPVGTPVDIIA